MEEILPDVFRISPTKLTDTKYVSFVVRRQGGNLLFPCFGGHSSIDGSFDDIEALGGLGAQLLGDMHFAARYNDDVYARFGVPLRCSDVEAPDVQRKVANVETFPFERHEVVPGVEAIPTPGHRPGAVSYLLVSNGKRLLFAGDTVYHDGEAWRCFTSKKNRKTMLETLELLADIPFDFLLANTGVKNPICYVEVDEAGRRSLIDGIRSRL